MSYGGLPGYGPPQPPPPGGGFSPNVPPPSGAAMPWEPLEVIQFAWQRLRADAGGVLLPLGVAIVIESIPGLIGNVIGPKGASDLARLVEPDAIRTTLFVQLAAIVVRSFLDGGIAQFCLDVVRGRPYSMATIFSRVGLFPAYFALNLLQLLLVGFGLALLVVPGVILAVGFVVAEPALVDRGLGAMGALGWSWEHTKGERWKVFVFFLLAVVVSLLGACACGVGMFVAIPILWIARARIYTSLSGG